MIVTILLYATPFPVNPVDISKKECYSTIDCFYECRKKFLRTPGTFYAKCSLEEDGVKKEKEFYVFSEKHRTSECDKYGVTGCLREKN